jgi:hypothetical protein
MRNLQLTARLAMPVLMTVVLACAAGPAARADGYDYGYGPVYGGYSVTSGTTCPNGNCPGSYYSPTYSASYPIYSTPSCPNGSCGLSGTCPSGTCGTCPNGSCGLRGQCAGGQCSGGQCSGGQCSSGLCPSGQCASGTCRGGRCGTCPNGDCANGNCRGDCPNGQCTTRYRGSVDPPSRPISRSYDRRDYGAPEAASYRPTYSSERPQYRDSGDRDYRDRDYRDEPVSRRSWRSESRPTSRDRDLESPFYN